MAWFKKKKEKKLEIEEDELITDMLLDKAREKPILGRAVISPGRIDQMTTLNPVTLEGQAEIIYNIWLYRTAKWHWNVLKADEYIIVTPSYPPAFASVMSQKERYEGMIKSGLASAAQAVADYELLRHDERKYREILDFFKEGKKEEHVLRALFVDRVDAFTGEGYSMITMTKRWPTIISDFIRMKREWDDLDTIMKNLAVSRAEATVLKTKNKIFKEWEKLFFPDVKERYARIKTLVESRRRSIDQYREWIKAPLQRYMAIKERVDIKPAVVLHDPMNFAHTPEGYIYAKLWVIKPIRPEEMGKPIMLQGQGYELDPYDDWVKEWLLKIEEKYGVKFTDKEIRNLIKEYSEKWDVSHKKGDIITIHGGPVIDPRYVYYIFIDLDYEVRYKRGSTGPMVMEDQYFHFHPFLISQNVLLLFLLELRAKEKKFERFVNELIGTRKIEDEFTKSIEEEFKEEDERMSRLESFFKGSERTMSFGYRLKKWLRPIWYLFMRPGPYEHTLVHRINKTFGDYIGPQVTDQFDLIKEVSYRMSGQTM
jgi:uncharacterized protein (DUF1778 family)